MSLLKEFEIDLADAPSELTVEIEQNEAAEATLLQKVHDRFDSDDPDQPSGFEHPAAGPFEEKFYELRQQRAELQGQRARISEFIEDPKQAGGWSDHRFEFREPSTDDALYVEGRSEALAEAAKERGETIDGRTFGVSQLLERIKIRGPPEAPDSLTGELPRQVGMWLLDALDAKSTTGVDSSLGNSSPREALANFKKSQHTSSGDQDEARETSPSAKSSS